MRTSTMLSPHNLAERDVASALEQQFDAAWFPEYHRCSIDTDDAFVAVDFDDEFADRLGPDEQRDLAKQFGFVPKTAVHVQSSVVHAGSPRLAENVLHALCKRFDGQMLPAA